MSRLKRPSLDSQLATQKRLIEDKETTRKMANLNKSRGRGYQTTLAKMVQGSNIGTLGGEDVAHDWFSFEAKTRKKFVGEEMMKQAVKNNPSALKMPVVAVHVVGEKHENDLIIMRFKDWSKLAVEEGV